MFLFFFYRYSCFNWLLNVSFNDISEYEEES